jgi:short-subunit dehydrogenase
MSSLALVTGASSGIGQVFARKLASRGFDLILVARRRDRLESLGRDLGAAHGVRVEVLPADLADDAGVRAVEARIEAAGTLDLLVNNAGFGSLGAFARTELEEQDRMHRLHVLATMRLTHAVLRGMVVRHSGAIINVSSVAGFMTAPGSVSYCATKHWMNVFTEGLYMELKNLHSPVKVQALCPGFTLTEFHDRIEYDRSSVPRLLWLKADFVVDESLRGLERGTLFVIPSLRYKLVVAFLGLIPRGLGRFLAVRRQRRFRRI